MQVSIIELLDNVTAEENAAKATFKKQKQQQRPRKERPQQHTFSHQLLASALKVIYAEMSKMKGPFLTLKIPLKLSLVKHILLINDFKINS